MNMLDLGWGCADVAEDYDGVQYDTMYAPDPQQLEAEAIRREIAEAAR